MKPSLRIIATMVAKTGSEIALRDLLVPAVEVFLSEPGCQGYLLHEDRKHAGRFVTYEAWSDEEALMQHMKSRKMLELAPKMRNLLEEDLRQEFLSVLQS